MSARKQEEKRESNNDFFQNVYDVVRLIPAGRATSYGAIASYLGSKRGARQVGWAMGSSYNVPNIPAHRVVNKEGVLTARQLFETPTTMQEKLEAEGVEVKDDQIQNWNKYFWDPEKELT
ncbi:MGMT family protein [Dyadobacter sp. CY312]|uniref:MGMT family protein n=1 Tax=Dyadobacter sp. CY312 TaxID=2907303 RepID=UPI001F303EFD|nr:MGMT family protein [Dyadobacter sp. CY312]MCE7043401.1 MGMT family protein [Dyadobacter sp. CY312]